MESDEELPDAVPLDDTDEEVSPDQLPVDSESSGNGELPSSNFGGSAPLESAVPSSAQKAIDDVFALVPAAPTSVSPMNRSTLAAPSRSLVPPTTSKPVRRGKGIPRKRPADGPMLLQPTYVGSSSNALAMPPHQIVSEGAVTLMPSVQEHRWVVGLSSKELRTRAGCLTRPLSLQESSVVPAGFVAPPNLWVSLAAAAELGRDRAASLESGDAGRVASFLMGKDLVSLVSASVLATTIGVRREALAPLLQRVSCCFA